MKNLCFLLALLPLVFGCGPHEQSATSPDFLVIDDNISNRKINAFAEDKFGYIWIATHRGLNRYNGFDFHQYYNTADSLSLIDNQVICLLADSHNMLWAGTVNGVSHLTHGGYFVNVPLASENRYITQIIETSSGDVLVNNGLALERYDRDEGVFRPFITFAPENFASRCWEDRSGRIWAVSPQNLTAYDTSKMRSVNSVAVEGPYIFSSFMQRNGVLWLLGSNGSGGGGIRLFDTRRDSFVETPAVLRGDGRLRGQTVKAVYEYSETMLMLYTSGRQCFLYNTLSGELVGQDDSGFPFTAPDADVTAMFTDSGQNLWIGSSDQSFQVVYNYKRQFNDNALLSKYFDGRSVISLASDKAGNLWTLTSLDGLHRIEHGTRQVHRVEVPGARPERRMLECFIDSRDNFWITFADGHLVKYRYAGGGEEAGRLVQEADHNLYTGIFCVTEDAYGNIWAGAFGSSVGVLAGGATGAGAKEFSPIEIVPPGHTFTPIMIPLRSGKVLAASWGWGFSVIDPADMSMERINMWGEVARSSFIPTALFEASDGTIWCGTIGNGLFTVNLQDRSVSHREGVQCNDISSIAEDALGNLWIGTLDGLFKYDNTVDRFFAYYGNDGIGGDQFNENCAIRSADNTMVFGATHGITFFNPIDIMPRRTARIVFEDLRINNAIQQAYKSDAIGSHMALKPEVTLRHSRNNFSISYVAMDFGEFPRDNYNYMLEGFDGSWIDARHNRQAFYSNLPPGRYDFRVRVINNSDMGVVAEDSISVRVKPSPWLSPVMVLGGYPLLFLLLVGTLVWLWMMVLRNRRIAELAVIEKENELRTNSMNMSFFSNISHEFRTPLTMISGPVELLAADPGLDREKRDLLAIVQRNAHRMLRLVNQLMDFNKLENDTLRLKVRSADVIAEVRRVVSTFLFTAKEKRISLTSSGLEDSFVMLLDEDKLEKILYNLLSNAVKFTPPDGKIAVSMDVLGRTDVAGFELPGEAKSYVRIDVADTGIGIPEQHLEDVFKRYYQVENQDKGPQWGTGIGLYYARRLAELHHGQIKAFVREEGGTVLSLLLPVDVAVYAEDRSRSDEQKPVAAPEPVVEVGATGVAEQGVSDAAAGAGPRDDMRTILVVEDDTEVSHFLKSMLSPYYNVVNRFDGASALESIEEVDPDLILSDVLMPGSDGYELCLAVKSNIAMSHIPVVLLTAKSTVADQVAGLDAGADAYVVKPFDPSYLLALVKSLLSNRDKLRNILSQTTRTDKIDEQMLSPHDKEFMDSLYALMEKELSNPELNVTQMTKSLKISRTKFYYKVKGLTGENPNVFFRTYKLNRAAELLKSGKHNISEVADITGFSTLSHFSVSFKKQFGVTPSEFLHG
uniref:Putative sensor histidine-kinase response regulator n=1 Tax=termite gut metagenome TaxID=433724 RepID=S0DE81_9ZZZZ